MNAKAAELYEAHVAYTLDQLTGDKLNALVEAETRFIWSQLANVRLNEVLTKEEVIEFQQRNFEHRRTVADPVKVYAKKLTQDLVEYFKNSDTKLSDVVEKSSYDKLVKEIAGLREIREKVIDAAVSNPLYGDVIANILSNGIKSFTSEEGLAGKLPGASSFFKMGSSLLGNLQDKIDTNIKKFISENIGKLTSQSGKYISGMINEQKIKDMGEQLWHKANQYKVSVAAGRLDTEQFKGFEPIIEDIANHALRSEPAAKLNEFIIDHYLDAQGNKSLQTLLTDIEVTEEDVVRESVELFAKIGAQSLKDGSLEARVRHHLEGFYASDIVAGIV